MAKITPAGTLFLIMGAPGAGTATVVRKISFPERTLIRQHLHIATLIVISINQRVLVDASRPEMC